VNQPYRYKETGVFLLNYHLIFCPKRRRPVLKGAVKTRLEEIIRKVAADIDAEVLALEIMPDHVHLFASAVPQMAPNQVVSRFKGASSRILRQEFPHLLRLPSLWTRSSFISTAGNVSSGTIRKYIEAQSKR
jgi:putative transposase